MNTLQSKLVSTWVIGPSAVLLALHESSNNGYSWVIILSAGAGICQYLRRDLPKTELMIFESMSGAFNCIIGRSDQRNALKSCVIGGSDQRNCLQSRRNV